jgi:hypothetical protein
MYQHYTMIIPKSPGMPGDAKALGDDVVGVLANGVLLDSHQPTWAYDNCNGHSDKKGQYHYHIPAKCFIESLDLSFASTESWWINEELSEVRPYAEMASTFPSTGPPSPVVGFALDGFPIFALYDSESGDLQRGAGFGGAVDECNGKLDSAGNYGYYITADPPFAPSCLKGKVGSFTYASTKLACPAEGISNQVLDPTDVTQCLQTSVATRSTATTTFETLSGCEPVARVVDPNSGASRVAAAAAAGAATIGALLF